MKYLKHLLIAAGVVALASVAIAQSPQLSKIPTGGMHPTTDLIQVVPNGAPQAQSQYAYPSQITGTYGYYKSAPATSFNYQVGANVAYVAFNPAGTLALGYVSLPTAPSDGQRSCVFSTQTITALYICATSTGVGNCVTTGINNPLAGSLSANSGLCYLYGSSNATWDRS